MVYQHFEATGEYPMNKVSIPQELVNAIKSSSVILFVGELLSQDAGLPSPAEAMLPLVKSLGMQPTLSHTMIADTYESIMGRHNLIRHIRDIFTGTVTEPTVNHSLLAALPIKIWVTTNYDNLLEHTLQQARLSHRKVIRAEDLAFLNSQDHIIVKIFGDIMQPDTLVITTRDQSEYHLNHEALETWLKGQLFNKTLLFIGYSLNNPIFNQIRTHIVRLLQGYERMSYAILPSASELQIATLRQDNIYCITASTDEYSSRQQALENILRRLVRLSKPYVAPILPINRLANEIRQWLQVLGYTITQEKQISDVEHDLKAEIRIGLMFQRVIVRCVDGEVTIPRLASLKRAAKEQSVSIAWAVSERRVPPSATQYTVNELDELQAFNLDDFIRRIIDFEPYFHWLEQAYRESNIPKYYVPLACEKPVFDESGRLINADRYKEIDAYIDDWLTASAKNHISILGNFGSGKTWFCIHYAYKLLQKYRNDPSHNRIPLLISLGDYATTNDIRQLITDLLINRYQVQMAGGFPVFQQLNDSGRLLLIFDGFDEMARKMDQQTVVENFWRLAEAVRPASKVILTCRTAYFRYRKEAEEILSGQRTRRSLINLVNKPEFEIINLLPFNSNQIRSVLYNRLGSEEGAIAFEQMNRIHDLSDLAKRPVMLEMIASSISQIIEHFKANAKLNVSDLYKMYVDQWIQKNIVEERTFLDPTSKRFFMEELAWQMYRDEISSVHYNELSDRILRYFKLTKAEDLDYFDYDLRTQAFLVRDHDGRYTFAHKSFMEYFTARYLYKVLDSYFNSDRTNEEEYRPTQHYQEPPTPDLIKTFGLRRLTQEVEQFLAGMRPEPEILWSAIAYTRGKSFKQVKHVGSNAASVLTQMGESFSKRDISRTVLRDANLSGVDLSEANCREIDGKGLNLQLSNLAGTDFSYSQLHHVILGDSDVIRGVIFTPDALRVICCGSEPIVRVIETETGNVLKKAPAHSCIRSIDMNSAGSILVGGGLDAVLRAWDISSMRMLCAIRAHNYPIYGIAYDPATRFIATASSDHTVKIWDINDEITKLEDERKVKLWSIERKEPVVVLTGHPHHVRSVAYEPTGKWLVSAGVRGLVKIWDPKTWKNIRTLTSEGDPGTFQVRFSPDGRYLAVGLSDKSMKIWCTDTWKLISVLRDHSGFVLSTAFHPEADEIATGSRDGTVTIWRNIESPVRHSVFKAHNDAILSLQYHPNGKRLIMGGGGNILKLWDLQVSELIWKKQFGGQNLLYQGMNITGVQGIVSHFLQFLRDQGAVDNDN
jgi:WD40 repeat protein